MEDAVQLGVLRVGLARILILREQAERVGR